MRDIARNPMDAGIILRVTDVGTTIEILAEKNLSPTMELPSHLLMHQVFAKSLLKQTGDGCPAPCFHTHPTELIALSHIKQLQHAEALTEVLYNMHPEVRLNVPQGLGWVPYHAPGSIELAKASIKNLDKHHLLLWEHHGILATGTDIVEVFDAVDILNKAAKIYLYLV